LAKHLTLNLFCVRKTFDTNFINCVVAIRAAFEQLALDPGQVLSGFQRPSNSFELRPTMKKAKALRRLSRSFSSHYSRVAAAGAPSRAMINDEKLRTPTLILSSSTWKFGAWFIAIIPFSAFDPPRKNRRREFSVGSKRSRH
jgi:hypothetical protein